MYMYIHMCVYIYIYIWACLACAAGRERRMMFRSDGQLSRAGDVKTWLE